MDPTEKRRDPSPVASKALHIRRAAAQWSTRPEGVRRRSLAGGSSWAPAWHPSSCWGLAGMKVLGWYEATTSRLFATDMRYLKQPPCNRNVFSPPQPPTSTYKHLQAPISPYNYLQALTSTYRQLQAPTSTYKHLQALTGTHRHLQARTSTYRHLQAPASTNRHPQAPTSTTTYKHPQAPTTT